MSVATGEGGRRSSECSRREDVKEQPGRMIMAWRILSGRPVEREKSYSYNDLGGFHILVLFKDSYGSVLA
jgi:hypothetical protein